MWQKINLRHQRPLTLYVTYQQNFMKLGARNDTGNLLDLRSSPDYHHSHEEHRNVNIWVEHNIRNLKSEGRGNWPKNEYPVY